ncbi:MAG: hypothetical protein KIT19_13900 [Phycisphaeraceae bacterium]|nr:hypothetical protein [Phycisphaeraceae bacterium]
MLRVASVVVLAILSGSTHAQCVVMPASSARYPSSMVDDVRRPGFNGLIYSRRPVIGGVDAWAVESGSPGADYYGAYGAENLAIGVVVDPIEPFNSFDYGIVSPWQVANDRSERGSRVTNPYNRARNRAGDRLERARHEWLRENGLTGGVRTHVNDATLHAPADRRESALPTPRATIQIPEGEPRLHRNIRVEGPARISLPPGASAEIVRHIGRTGGFVGDDQGVIRIANKD